VVLQGRGRLVDPSVRPQAEVVLTTPTAFVVRLQWRPTRSDQDRELFQVLSMGGDRIRRMADYRTVGAAVRAAG
jgi:hypothetical protein